MAAAGVGVRLGWGFLLSVAWGAACNLPWMTLPASFLPFKGFDMFRFLGGAWWGLALCYQGTQTSVEAAPRTLWVVSTPPAVAASVGSLGVLGRAHMLLILRTTLPAGGKASV